MTVPNSKPFYASMTLWGVIITIAGGVLAHFGYNPSKADTVTSAKYIDLISKIIELGIGPIVTIIGRLRAKRPLTLTPGSAILLLPMMLLTMFTTGCASETPTLQAAEVRSLYKEAQHQVAIAKTDPTLDQSKVTDLQHKLDLIGPGIDALEVAAAESEKNGGKWIDFQQLMIQYKPQVEGLIISIVLKRYLGQ